MHYRRIKELSFLYLVSMMHSVGGIGNCGGGEHTPTLENSFPSDLYLTLQGQLYGADLWGSLRYKANLSYKN
jgi:hypothetical protein